MNDESFIEPAETNEELSERLYQIERKGWISPKEALERQKQYRLKLAREFRQAVEMLRLAVPEEGKDYER
jgi:hypothetical protein